MIKCQITTTRNQRLTINGISKLFFKYNRMYFENKLAIPSFGLLHSKVLLGLFRTKNDKRTGKEVKPKIFITADIEWSEDDLRDVLVHEMVHMAVWQRGGKTRNRHDGMFKDICDELEAKYGIRVRKPIILKKPRRPKLQFLRQCITKLFH